MPPFDAEMVEPLHAHMRAKGCELHLGDGERGPPVLSTGAAACCVWQAPQALLLSWPCCTRGWNGTRVLNPAPPPPLPCLPGVAGFEQGPGGKGLVVNTQSGKEHAADLVMLVSPGGEGEGE